jgi:hypothetical protein
MELNAKTQRRRENQKLFASLRLCAFALKIGRAEINGCGRDAENGNRGGRAPQR